MSISAIETEYRGHLFRSRLEARWAVIFDHLGIEWIYEPEGFEWKEQAEGFGGHSDIRTFRYLPDFFLPEPRVYSEVKGEPSIDDIRLLASAAVPWWGLPSKHEPEAYRPNRILLLGKIADEWHCPCGIMLYWSKGSVFWKSWEPWWDWKDEGQSSGGILFGDNGDFSTDEAQLIIRLLNNGNGRPDVGNHNNKWVNAATAGRKARFEHGENPSNHFVP